MLDLQNIKYKFNAEKNLQLQQMPDRLISFEKVIEEIIKGHALDIRTHPNQIKYPNQYIIYVYIEEEVYAVPCVEEADGSLFLKTIFPSRKARAEFFPESKNNKKSKP
jgi:hypothetical protein